MAAVLRMGASRFARYTGLVAGALLAIYILVEAPLSGTSMNPARTLASALFDGNFSALLLYFVAPPLGMLLATFLPLPRGCAKVVHDARVPCIFCAQRPPPPDRKRIVILGGGFGGVFAAAALEKRLGARDDVEIVLVSKENYFVFQPMLPEVISGSIGLLDTVSPIRRLLRHTNVHVRQIESVDLVNRTVTTTPGFRPHSHVIPFDHLVLALGSVTDFRGQRGLPEHAFPFKDLGDAVLLRNHVIHALEEAAIEGEEARIRIKVNNLQDAELIEELYAASQDGVKIDIVARSICTIRPGVPDLSETIRVRSILGRFLEHSRFFIFDAGSKRSFLLGSADLMPRNLDHRIELLAPVEDGRAQQDLLRAFDVLLADNASAWEMSSEGRWMRLRPKKGDRGRQAQLVFMRSARARARRRAASGSR